MNNFETLYLMALESTHDC